MQSRFAERELQTEQKKVTAQSDRRDLRRQVHFAWGMLATVNSDFWQLWKW